MGGPRLQSKLSSPSTATPLRDSEGCNARDWLNCMDSSLSRAAVASDKPTTEVTRNAPGDVRPLSQCVVLERPLMADCVEKLEKSRGCENLANEAHWRFLPLQGAVELIRRPTIVFAVIDVVPHIAARETHQRSGEFSVISEKGLFQHNRREAVIRFERLTKFGREFRKSSLSRWMLWFPVAAASLSHGSARRLHPTTRMRPLGAAPSPQGRKEAVRSSYASNGVIR